MKWHSSISEYHGRPGRRPHKLAQLNTASQATLSTIGLSLIFIKSKTWYILQCNAFSKVLNKSHFQEKLMFLTLHLTLYISCGKGLVCIAVTFVISTAIFTKQTYSSFYSTPNPHKMLGLNVWNVLCTPTQRPDCGL